MTDIKYALTIGINYTGSQLQLKGCEKDCNAMNTYFMAKSYKTVMMTNSAKNVKLQPTKTNIITQIKAITAIPELRNMAIFFAGHGTQVSDVNGDEADGKDEAIVCQSNKGARFLPTRADLFTDDELIALLHEQLHGKSVELFLMFDSCHSGSVMDLAYVYNGTKFLRERGHAPLDATYSMICFSASRDVECAIETIKGGNATNAFLNASQRGANSIQDFYTAFSTLIGQRPVISAASKINTTCSIFGPIEKERAIVSLTVPQQCRSLVYLKAIILQHRYLVV